MLTSFLTTEVVILSVERVAPIESQRQQEKLLEEPLPN